FTLPGLNPTRIDPYAADDRSPTLLDHGVDGGVHRNGAGFMSLRLRSETPWKGISCATCPLISTNAARLHVAVPPMVATWEVVFTAPVGLIEMSKVKGGASGALGLIVTGEAETNDTAK